MKLIVILENLIFKCPSELTTLFRQWNHKFQLNEGKKCRLGRGKWIFTFCLFWNWWICMLRWREESNQPKKWTVSMIVAGNGTRSDCFSKNKSCVVNFILILICTMSRISFHSNTNQMFVVQIDNKYYFIVMQWWRAVVICHSEMKLWAWKRVNLSNNCVNFNNQGPRTVMRKKLLKNLCE